MENRISFCFFIFIVLLSTHLQSQNYTPFPQENMQWTTVEVHPQFGLADDDLVYWRIYTVGDTLINGMNYTSLQYKWECWVRHDFNNNVTYISTFPNATYPHDNYLVGAIREEDKRIYFYPYELNWLSTGGIYGLEPHQDHLLYDFNVMPGDTVHFSTTQWIEQINGNPVYHTEEHFTLINSVPGNGTYNVSPSDSWSFPNTTGLWTEGVGSSFGLMGSYHSLLTSLVCSGPIEPVACTPCASAVAVNEAFQEDRIEVFPNPAASEIIIRNNSDLGMKSFQLFDMYGRLLREKNCPNQQRQIELDISDLPGSFFVLKVLLDGNYTLNRKIIKN